MYPLIAERTYNADVSVVANYFHAVKVAKFEIWR